MKIDMSEDCNDKFVKISLSEYVELIETRGRYLELKDNFSRYYRINDLPNGIRLNGRNITFSKARNFDTTWSKYNTSSGEVTKNG